MNNTQLCLSVGLPVLTIILTWLASRVETNRQIDRLDRQLETMRTELRGELSREASGIRAELAAIKDSHHKDFVSLMSYMVPLHERMAKIESKK